MNRKIPRNSSKTSDCDCKEPPLIRTGGLNIGKKLRPLDEYPCHPCDFISRNIHAVACMSKNLHDARKLKEQSRLKSDCAKRRKCKKKCKGPVTEPIVEVIPPAPPMPPTPPSMSSLLDVIQNRDTCICEVVARATAECNVHSKLRLSSHRDYINGVAPKPPSPKKIVEEKKIITPTKDPSLQKSEEKKILTPTKDPSLQKSEEKKINPAAENPSLQKTN